MRAVQITRFGGPEVLDVVDLPDPVPGPGQQLYEVSAAGVNFADTHQIENSYLASAAAAAGPRRRVRRHPGRRRPAGRRAAAERRRLRRAGRRRHDAADLGRARRRHRRAGARRRPAGRDRLAPAAHQRPPGRRASPSSSSPAPAASARSPSSWPSAGAPAGSSPRRPAPEKRALAEELGADATVDPALADDDPKTFTAALREANGGSRVDVVLEMTGGNVFDGALSALAPFGRLVTYGMAARQDAAAGARRRR